MTTIFRLYLHAAPTFFVEVICGSPWTLSPPLPTLLVLHSLVFLRRRPRDETTTMRRRTEEGMVKRGGRYRIEDTCTVLVQGRWWMRCCGATIPRPRSPDILWFVTDLCCCFPDYTELNRRFKIHDSRLVWRRQNRESESLSHHVIGWVISNSIIH